MRSFCLVHNEITQKLIIRFRLHIWPQGWENFQASGTQNASELHKVRAARLRWFNVGRPRAPYRSESHSYIPRLGGPVSVNM